MGRVNEAACRHLIIEGSLDYRRSGRWRPCIPVAWLFSHEPFPCEVMSQCFGTSAMTNLTIRVPLQKRVQNLQVARDLFPRPSFSGQLVDILGDEFIATVGLSTLRPFPTPHRRICLKRCTPRMISERISSRCSAAHLAGRHLQVGQTKLAHHLSQCHDEA